MGGVDAEEEEDDEDDEQEEAQDEDEVVVSAPCGRIGEEAEGNGASVGNTSAR